ncbi:MAG: hypothetical protein HKN85_01100 [Gammaproteobacteria bacterium]|nr:hypothetical protein [Gammaproteobacteria bacterium]
MIRFIRSVFALCLACFSLISQAEQDQSEQKIIGVEAFGCIRDMTPVGEFFVANYKGDLDGTVQVASSETGGVYPPGSIVQLVPGEAMIKHDKGFNPATKDWEFVELDVSAEETLIRKRGFADVVNRFGGNCFACHIKAQPEFDLICAKNDGCDPIPLTADMIKGIQNTDPRCAAMELPAEQIAALQQLKAAMQKTAPAE